jgi:hypothetical protein
MPFSSYLIQLGWAKRTRRGEPGFSLPLLESPEEELKSEWGFPEEGPTAFVFVWDFWTRGYNFFTYDGWRGR